MNFNGNFATEEYSDAWGYSGVTGSTTFDATVNGESGAMKVESAGSSWYAGHTIYLRVEIIAYAKSLGKTKISFSWASDNAVGLYEYSGTRTSNSDNFQ